MHAITAWPRCRCIWLLWFSVKMWMWWCGWLASLTCAWRRRAFTCMCHRGRLTTWWKMKGKRLSLLLVLGGRLVSHPVCTCRRLTWMKGKVMMSQLGVELVSNTVCTRRILTRMKGKVMMSQLGVELVSNTVCARRILTRMKGKVMMSLSGMELVSHTVYAWRTKPK